MKWAIRFLILTTVALSFVAFSATASTPDFEVIQKAEQFVHQLAAEDYASATSDFDSTMAAAMPPAKLKETWQSVLTNAGPYVSIEGTDVVKQGDYDVAVVTTKFQNMRLDIKAVYNSTGQMAGLWFAPAAPKAGYLPPPYSDSTKFHEVDIKVGSGDFALPGTISMPNGAGPFPAIVLVHGSGPNDRDETVGPNKPFRDIAWGLASKGVAVLRYEKRTRAFPQQYADSLNKFTVKEETVDDAAAAFDLLDSTKGIVSKRVFVLGHSLGGMLIPRIAKLTPGAAGYVIMAGAARPLGDMLLEQVSYIDSTKGPITAKERAELDTLKAQVELSESPTLTLKTPASKLPMGVHAAYWLDLQNYKPAEVAAKINKPMLILQGARDYQVTVKDFDIWKKALGSRANVVFKLYPDLNHLFITGNGRSVPSEYDQAGHVSEKVIGDVAAWISQH